MSSRRMAGAVVAAWMLRAPLAHAQAPQPQPVPGAQPPAPFPGQPGQPGQGQPPAQPPPQQAPPGAPQPAPYGQPAPYPQQQPAPYGQPAPYPQQQPAPYGQPAPYPQQPAPGPGYPPPPGQYAPPGAYPQGAPYPQQPGSYPPPGYPQGGQYPYPPQGRQGPDPYRSPGEMGYLYGVSLAYGVGTGVWLDSLAGANDPGIALIAPLALGAAMPVGVYLWDANAEFGRGVPSSIATGMLLGGVEGMAVSGLQWQLTGGTNGTSSQWGFSTWSSITFLGATAGGLGGFAFGEWFHPDPRTLAFISSGAGWGALAGGMFGAGVVGDSGSAGNGAAVGGFVAYNAGLAAAGIVSAWYTPSWASLKYMWLGDLLGTVATTPVYLFYIGGGQAQHGLIANSLGGLAGLTIATLLTANMTDPSSAAAWTPPLNVAVSPTPYGGAQLSASGQW